MDLLINYVTSEDSGSNYNEIYPWMMISRFNLVLHAYGQNFILVMFYTR